MQIDLNECCRLLATADDILILTHKNPDGDTIGSAYGLYYALRSIGKHARVECSDPLPRRFSYFYPAEEFEEFEPRFVVAVDVADPQLLGKLECWKDRVDLCIDHHISNTGYAEHLLLDADAAAAAEIIRHVIEYMGIQQDQLMASALYTGIATDTGCFRYPNTTAETHKAAARLMRVGIDAGAINKILFETKSRSRMELERRVMDTLQYTHDDRCAFIEISLKTMEETGALEEEVDGISSIPRQIEGVLAAVTLREKADGEYKISLRSDGVQVNASAVCRSLGGGGHKAAAGCTVKGSLEEVRAILIDALDRALKGELR